MVDVDYRLCPGKEPTSQKRSVKRGKQITRAETTWGKCIVDAWDALKWVRSPLPRPSLTLSHLLHL